ncbi:polysaccharide deacetylase family protein [Paenibacillus sp. HJL G12]|uniref:Polysaccharide deacetylase family protein n=1 Tax=Paenibacillus dendrobii TaxID=2691084 RepID=A0A7X3ILX7_9BACL|nr:polysaccharide deacetylase family protein [Paenibacillus dendrobii]MWV44447.1 polysaccharide deacetylase family protein [Paenibacillus dendrobii]
MSILFKLIVLFILIYMLIPFVITRVWGMGVAVRGRAGRQIALTFDDGPDPLYTPRLLDLLQKKGIKATFFVLGSKAERYPELIKRIYLEGHQIGIHNYTHLPNWLMSPRHIREKHVGRTADVIERITGERPTFYRPPWGILNIGDLFTLRKTYHIVLWSIMARDWGKERKKKPLKERILSRLEPGSIIVLHDSGDTFGAVPDAPGRMIADLEEALGDARIQGYVFVRTDELLRQAHGARNELSDGLRVG